MNIKRIDEIATRMDKWRALFTDLGLFTCAADFRDVYMILREKRDQIKEEPCPSCKGSGKSESA